MRGFAKFFFAFGRFPGSIDHLLIILKGQTPSFIKERDIILPFWLYQNFNYGDSVHSQRAFFSCL